ncbi:putative disease resistance protein RGA3 [Morella rubra]|uniref:Putative disease resistance protein RGA3 n=1 Tax=Morella rubra TaxID=262757 RepID=A0A6A1ULZ2_9ROSI|nr:putative disease resistance protein RGA3 [Morella rubra]
MAEAFSIAGSVAAQAIGSLGSPVLKELGMLWGLKGELQKLQNTVSAIQAKLLDAEEKQAAGDNATRTEEKRGVSSSEGRDSHSFVLAEEVFGREDDKEKLIGLLLRESNLRDNVAILSIVGIGGLGKTTLAQLLFNDEKVKKHFELKMWVCVSDNFDVGEIVKKMIESATDKKPGDVGMDSLIREVGKVIGGKKYFLVLDDVWNEDDIKKWDDLEKLLLCGARGSRVLVTTRSEKVANIGCSVESYKLKGLEEHESWSLFKQMAFRNRAEPESSTFIAIGKEILKECRGVPLVIRTIGRLETLSRGIQHLTALQTLELRYCDELDLGKDDDWMQGQGLKSLRTLNIYSLPKLVSLPEEGLRNLTSLQDLSIDSCKDKDWMQGQGLKSLRTLKINPSYHSTSVRDFSCVSLTAVPDWIHKWRSLEEFTIRSCTSLTSLPEGMRRLTSLRNLTIIDCPILLQRCEKDKGKDWPKIAHIPDLKVY